MGCRSILFVLTLHKSLLRHFNVPNDKLIHLADKTSHKRNLMGWGCFYIVIAPTHRLFAVGVPICQTIPNRITKIVLLSLCTKHFALIFVNWSVKNVILFLTSFNLRNSYIMRNFASANQKKPRGNQATKQDPQTAKTFMLWQRKLLRL